MKNILILSLLLSLCSCNSLLKQSELEPSRIDDINAIVGAVIRQDSVKVMKTDIESVLFCNDLNKLKIYLPKKGYDSAITSIAFSNARISIDNLLGNKGASLFSAKDSLYLLQQNTNPRMFLIDTIRLPYVKYTSMDVEQEKMRHYKTFEYYQMTLPIFSLDNTIAYVELNHYCSGGLCGSGQAIYLKKINGTWVISFERMTWIS